MSAPALGRVSGHGVRVSRAPDAAARAVPGPRLLADIGGTHARFAWQDGPGGPLRAVQVLRCADHASLLDAARHYLRSQGLPAPVDGAVGIANPVLGDTVHMTNHHWSFSIEAVRQSLGLNRLRVLNDFTALALALPLLPPTSLRLLGGGSGDAQAPRALIGPGTGLGVSGLVWGGQGWVALQTEGGHVSLSARTAREWALLQAVQARHGHASAERLLSGPGLETIYMGLAALDGLQRDPLPAAALDAAAQAGDPLAEETLQLFLALLGTTAGNLALSLGARGGVYLGGGILPRLGHRLAGSALRERFEDKGRFRPYLQSIPLWLIDSPASPALLGAAQALDPGDPDPV